MKKRLLLLSVCILFMGALVAQAEIVYVTPTVTSYNATFEKVVLHITQLVGDDVPQGDIITSFGGTWTLTGGTFDLPGTSTTFKANIYNTGDLTPGAGGDIPVAGPAVTPPDTWINMANLTPDTPTRSGGITTSSSFYAGWYAHTPGEDGIPVYALGVTDHTPGDGLYYNTDDELFEQLPGYGFDNTLLGVLYVSKTTQLTPGTVLYSGLNGFGNPNGGGSLGGVPTDYVITPVPEPTSLALLGCGLFGLLAYAWRKRK